MLNSTIADIFKEMSILFNMSDVQFKPRAYEKAATEIRLFPDDILILYKKSGIKGLDTIPSVGRGMAEKIEEYIKTKKIQEYKKLKKKFPVDVLALSAVEGVGPKMIKEMYKHLKIKNVKQLEMAVKNHDLLKLPHIKTKTANNIYQSIQFLKKFGGRSILGGVLPIAQTIQQRLEKTSGVQQAVICGSIRRRKDTVGDIDILVASTNPKEAHTMFTSMPEVSKIMAQGQTKSSVRLQLGIVADLRVVPQENFGSALQYFTGSKSHNVTLRKRATSQGMKLNEYGLFKGKKCIASKTEKEIYEKLGLDYIEPELRTNSGEIEAAQKHSLPKLIPYGSVVGDLQVHTNWTDGHASLEKMVYAAMKLGRQYIAISDHTKSLVVTGGLDEKKLAEQGKMIDAMNTKLKKQKKKFRILKGAEVNILKDGSLDINNSALAQLDIVGVAVHSHFKLTRAEMTKRIITAIQNPYVNILYHPTGRRINKRPGYQCDMKAIIQTAKKNKVALEIDANPSRSDLNDKHAREAVQAEVMLVIDTDAHAPDNLSYITLGEAIARRGWVQKKDVVNTLPLNEFLAYFKKK